MKRTLRLLPTAVALVFTTASGIAAQAPAAGQSGRGSTAPAGQTPAPATAQTTPAPGAPPAPTPTGGTTAGAAPAAGIAGPQLEPQGYTYDPQGRRDPFISLLRRGNAVARPTGVGIRPPGLAGLETNEVTLKGTVASQGSYVGILQGSDSKTYIVKAGDKLLDGTIRTINPDSLVITQQVTDPLSLEKQREVRKVLRQTEEAK
jgi:type IV pilus assembly protein PilP